MRKKLGVITVAAAALLAGPVVVSAPPASASTCASAVPVVCDVYLAVAGVACSATAKFADCIQ